MDAGRNREGMWAGGLRTGCAPDTRPGKGLPLRFRSRRRDEPLCGRRVSFGDKLYYNYQIMVKKRRNIPQSIMIPITGIGVVILSIVCFLLFLWVLIIGIRVVLG